jgi:hypothetical protein
MAIHYPGYALPRADLAEAYSELEVDPTLYIADQVAPDFNSKVRGGTYPRRKKASLLQLVQTLRAARGGFNRIDARVGDASFQCETHGLEGVVDDEERALYENDFDAEMAIVQAIHEALAIAREIRVKNALLNTGVWTGDSLYTDVSAAPWATGTSDWIVHVIDAVEKVRQLGHSANALILGAGVIPSLLKSQVTRAQFPAAPMITVNMLREKLADLAGVQKVLIGRARYDAAGEDPTGATAPVLTDIWPTNFAMVARVAEPGSSLSTPSVMRTIRWSRFEMGRRVMQYREEQTMGDVFREMECVDELVIDESAAHLLKIAA